MFRFRVRYTVKGENQTITADLEQYAQSDQQAADLAADSLKRHHPGCTVTILDVTEISIGYF